MTEAMPFLQKYDITFLRPPTIWRGDFFWLLYCAIAIVRLCAHIIIIYNDIHARAEPAGILQKIRV